MFSRCFHRFEFVLAAGLSAEFAQLRGVFGRQICAAREQLYSYHVFADPVLFPFVELFLEPVDSLEDDSRDDRRAADEPEDRRERPEDFAVLHYQHMPPFTCLFCKIIIAHPDVSPPFSPYQKVSAICLKIHILK